MNKSFYVKKISREVMSMSRLVGRIHKIGVYNKSSLEY
jgi:hypothetical protein